MFAYSNPEAEGCHSLKRVAWNHTQPRLREAAVSVLSYIHSDEAWGDLAELLESTDPVVRNKAMLGLHQTVEFGRTGKASPFERKLMDRGISATRSARRRPEVPELSRAAARVEKEDVEALSFWKRYVRDNP